MAPLLRNTALASNFQKNRHVRDMVEDAGIQTDSVPGMAGRCSVFS
jgi:hypothetical protein